jgi:hypothetical protein
MVGGSRTAFPGPADGVVQNRVEKDPANTNPLGVNPEEAPSGVGGER